MGPIRHHGVFVALALAALLALMAGCARAGDERGDAMPASADGDFSQAPGAQVIMLGLDSEGYYVPREFTVEADKPVTLRNDGTIRGCGSFVVQQELGIRADFTRSQDYTFTPTKKGTFTYTCSMGMFRGTIKVV